MTRWAMCACVLSAVAAGCGDDREINLLGRLGPTRWDLVKQAFESPDPDLRREAIEKTSSHRWGRTEAFGRAYALKTEDGLGDPREEHRCAQVRVAALRALARMGAAAQLDCIIARLGDSSESVRVEAAVTLDRVTGPAAVEPLRRAVIQDPAPSVRAAAAAGLRHYHRPEVLRTLVAAVGDPALLVRHAAAGALRELTGCDAGLDARQWQRVLEADAGGAARPAARPWWDWLGLTGPRSAPAAPAEAPDPTTTPATSPAATEP